MLPEIRLIGIWMARMGQIFLENLYIYIGPLSKSQSVAHLYQKPNLYPPHLPRQIKWTLFPIFTVCETPNNEIMYIT